jgi:hypothetical protein
MLRVALGHARPDREWTGSGRVSDLNFSPGVALSNSDNSTAATGRFFKRKIDLEYGSNHNQDFADRKELSAES